VEEKFEHLAEKLCFDKTSDRKFFDQNKLENWGFMVKVFENNIGFVAKV